MIESKLLSDERFEIVPYNTFAPGQTSKGNITKNIYLPLIFFFRPILLYIKIFLNDYNDIRLFMYIQISLALCEIYLAIFTVQVFRV